MMVAQDIYPHLFEICPLIMRTQGILLVKDALSITTRRLRLDDGALSRLPIDRIDPWRCVTGEGSGRWKWICDKLVARLDEYSDALLRSVREFLQIGDIQGAEIIQSSCVGCLTHLAVLCDFVGGLEPNSKPRMDAVCDSSLERLGHLTQEMSFEGYTTFDLLLRVRHWVNTS